VGTGSLVREQTAWLRCGEAPAVWQARASALVTDPNRTDLRALHALAGRGPSRAAARAEGQTDKGVNALAERAVLAVDHG